LKKELKLRSIFRLSDAILGVKRALFDLFNNRFISDSHEKISQRAILAHRAPASGSSEQALFTSLSIRS
jgi:hypothetical protein